MGSRRDRIVAVARYLGAASGIPGVTTIGYSIKAPFPYTFIPFTGKALQKWSEAARSLTGWQFLVWPQSHVEVQDTLVTMRAHTLAELLAAHYEAGLARRKGLE